MARPRKQTSIDNQIAAVALQFAHQISQIVRQNIAQEVTRLVVGGGAGPSLLVKRGRPAGVKAKQTRNFPAHCVYPGCSKAHKGPRFSFLCEEHMGISKAEKAKIKAQRTLETGASKRPVKASARVKKGSKRKLTAAGRKSLSDKMKARWAAKRSSANGKAAKKSKNAPTSAVASA